MDIDGESPKVDIGLLLLQQTETMSAKQARIVEQQEILVLNQKEIHCEVQQLQRQSTSPRCRRRSKPQSQSLASGGPHIDDADDEGDGSSEEETPIK